MVSHSSLNGRAIRFVPVMVELDATSPAVALPGTDFAWLHSPNGVIGRIRVGMLSEAARSWGCVLARPLHETSFAASGASSTDVRLDSLHDRSCRVDRENLSAYVALSIKQQLPKEEEVPVEMSPHEWDAVVLLRDSNSAAPESSVGAALPSTSRIDVSAPVQAALQKASAEVNVDNEAAPGVFVASLRDQLPFMSQVQAMALLAAIQGGSSIAVHGIPLVPIRLPIEQGLERVLCARRACTRASLRLSQSGGSESAETAIHSAALCSHLLPGDFVELGHLNQTRVSALRPFRVLPRPDVPPPHGDAVEKAVTREQQESATVLDSGS